MDEPGATIAATPVGSGPDLVLLHSLLTDRSVWDAVVPALADHRRVWLVDLPGFGGSAPADADIAVHADRIAAFLDAQDLPADTAIVGNGLGAVTALALAERHADRIGRVVLAGVAAAFPDEASGAFATMATRARAQGMAAVVDIAVRRIFTEDYLRANPDALRARREVLVRTDPAAFADACDALRAVDLRPGLAAVSSPTLVLVGDSDEATPPARAREVAAGIPDAHLVTMADCAHAPQLQHPVAFVDRVTAFLA